MAPRVVGGRAAAKGRTPAVCCAASSAKVPNARLLEVARHAADVGAQVVMAAADKPKNLARKEGTDIVTETDKAAEVAIVDAILKAFPDHAVLGEEGGMSGNPASEYLWCIDPLDGTVNFAHGYPGFNVSVGVLRHATAVAGCVIEFVGAPGDWRMRKYYACRNGGAMRDGKPISVSGTKELRDAVVATELSWYPKQWPFFQRLHTEFTQRVRGTRMCGAAAANLCHLAEGMVDAYWQFNLKPWDAAAGVVIAEEAGARLATANGTAYSVFDRSIVATNDAVFEKVLEVTGPLMEEMHDAGVAVPPFKVAGYSVKTGAQLE